MANETISYDRLLDIFLDYIDQDIYYFSPEEISEKLLTICTEEEIETLGLFERIWEQSKEYLEEDFVDDLEEDFIDDLEEDFNSNLEEDPEEYKKNTTEQQSTSVSDSAINLSKNSDLTYQVLYKKNKSNPSNVGYTDNLEDALKFAHNVNIVEYCIYNQKEKVSVESR